MLNLLFGQNNLMILWIHHSFRSIQNPFKLLFKKSAIHFRIRHSRGRAQEKYGKSTPHGIEDCHRQQSSKQSNRPAHGDK